MTSMSRCVATACVLTALAMSACTPRQPLPEAPAATAATATSPTTTASGADSWVYGTVINGENGKPIPTVTLTLYFQEIESTPRAPVRGKSNSKGQFSFGPVTSGLHCVLASNFGYHSVAREFTLQRAMRDTVNIVLYRQTAKTSIQRCSPNRASIDMCPLPADSATRGTERTRCSGQP